MEPASQVEAKEARDLLEAQLRESFGRLAYTHKTQEKCADIKLADFDKMRWVQTGLSALTSGGFFALLFAEPAQAHDRALWAGIASTLLIVANAYMQGSNAPTDAEKHRTTASLLWSAREAHISLITDLRSGTISIDDARKRRDELETKLAEIYAAAPRTSSRAYKEAQKALKLNEELTFSDAEIDHLLPNALRKTPLPVTPQQ
jgi:hypothetical protein